MDHNVISSILTFFTTLSLSILVYFKKKESSLNRIYALYSLSISVWSFGFLKMITADDPTEGLFWARALHVGAIFIPMLYIHVAYTLLNISRQNRKIFFIGYTICFLLLAICPTSLFVSHAPAKPHFKFFVGPGVLYHIFTLFFFTCVIHSQYKLFKGYRILRGQKRNQIKYVFIAYLIGYTGGAVAFAPLFDIPTPTWGLYPIPIAMLVITYAIVRHRLMDINIAIRKTLTHSLLALAISIGIVCIVLLPTTVITKSIVAFAFGLFLITHLPRLKFKIEDTVTHIIYKDKYKYQEKLEDFIEKIVGILEKEKLFKDIASALAKNLGVDTVSIFIYDITHRDYLLKTQIGLDGLGDNFRIHENGLIEWLRKNRTVFVKEEMEKALPIEKFTPIHEAMINLSASVCVPAMFRDDLVGFITLGEKNSGEMYSHIDTRLLYRLGVILATTLNLREKETRLMEQQAMGYIMTMAKELSHQLRNRLVATQTYFTLLPERQNDPAFRDEFSKIALNDINVLTHKLTEMMFFANLEKPRPKYSPLDMMITAALLLAQKRIREKNIEIKKELERNLPQLFVDEEVITSTISNIIDNAAGAVADTGGQIVISANLLHELSNDMKQKSGQWIRIIIKDNGCGMSKDTLGKIFEPFFTTRSGGTEIMKMGLGLGLVISKMIVEAHGGNITIDSEENKGTTVTIDLPVANKDLLEGDYLPPEGVFHGKA